jgi:hypothetical protein
MDGMKSSQLISDVKGRYVEPVQENRNEFKVAMTEDAQGDARIEGTLSTDGKLVPVTRVVLKKESGEGATFVIKYKTNVNDETWSTFKSADGTKEFVKEATLDTPLEAVMVRIVMKDVNNGDVVDLSIFGCYERVVAEMISTLTTLVSTTPGSPESTTPEKKSTFLG